MIADPVSYLIPAHIDEAGALKARLAGQARALSGGTTLVSLMTLGHVRPASIIDLRRCGLDAIEVDDDALTIGTAVTYRALIQSSAVARAAPLLIDMARHVTGGPQIRNQGTVGGSACYANPASDAPACLVALDARMEIMSGSGRRQVPAIEFFTGAFETCLADDEVLVRIVVPLRPAASRAFRKLKISESSWPIVSVSCVLLDRAGEGFVARIGVGGATATPMLLQQEIDRDVVQRRVGATGLRASIVDRVSSAIGDEWIDELAGPGYRRRVAGVIVARAVLEAIERAAP